MSGRIRAARGRGLVSQIDSGRAAFIFTDVECLLTQKIEDGVEKSKISEYTEKSAKK